MKNPSREFLSAEAEQKLSPPSRVIRKVRKRSEVLVSRDSVTAEDEREAGYDPVESRHIARQVALQMAYSIEIAGMSLDEVWAGGHLTGQERHIEFIRRLLQTMLQRITELDEEIRKRVERWSIDRLALADHLLLRLALCELLFMEETPPKVVLNEAIELAKEFSTTQSGRFINGILDASLGDRLPGKNAQ